MSLRRVQAIRYSNPMREGGSLPGLIEADDGRLYVVKLRGAGQGPLALVAEIITGEVARLLGLQVPDIVLVELDHPFGRQEHDAEIRDLLRASVGLNVGLRYLEGSTTFDPAAGDAASSAVASMIVWLDAFTMNVDRTSRNPNLLQWARDTWLIDHGASLYFHHHWPAAEAKVASPFEAIREHVLLRWAGNIGSAAETAREVLAGAALERIVRLVPPELLVLEPGGEDCEPEWRRYSDFLERRLANPSIFEEEVRRARAVYV